MNKNNFIVDLAKNLKARDNPVDLKASIVGVVRQVSPVVVSIAEDIILLREGSTLFISEWFRFRCNIDKTKALSSLVFGDRENSASNNANANQVEETHSSTGSPCSMPNAISLLATSIDFLSDAILQINTELLQLKCELKVGDYVLIASLEQENRYVLLDKILHTKEGKV